MSNDHPHSVNGNTIKIGIFDDPAESFAENYQILTLGHELFHILQNAEYGTTKTEISYEVEARLFEYHLALDLEIDLDTFFLNFANDNYKDAFIDFAEGENNTIDDFNELIDGFKTGTNGGNTYDHYTAPHIDSWEDIIWDNFN